MPRTDLFIKIEIDHDAHESPQAIGDELCRRIMKFHGVRSAELSSFVAHAEPE